MMRIPLKFHELDSLTWDKPKSRYPARGQAHRDFRFAVKAIGEVCDINRGRVMSKDYLRNNAGWYPVYSSQTANGGIFGHINAYDYDFESITWTTDGANAGSVFFHRDKKFSITNVCGLLKVKDSCLILAKFIYYTLGKTAKKYVSSGMGNPKLMSNAMSKIPIPVPPIEIQREIVKVLDTFTELEAEMEAELEARQKQYQYYRDALLSFDEGREDIRWMTLREMTSFRRGSFPQPYGNSEWYDGEQAMPFVQVVDVGKDMLLVEDTKRKISKLAQAKSVFVPADTVIVSLQGSIGRVAITQYDSYVDRTLAIFERFKIEVNKRYFAYQVQKKFGLEKETARGSTIKTITKEELASFLIPVPSLSEQSRIVGILDKFDALVNDLSFGLPAEIKARRKQYEHYRDRLLTFEEAV